MRLHQLAAAYSTSARCNSLIAHLSDNSARFLAGGILNFQNLEIGNTILKRGDSGENIYNNTQGIVTSLGYNVSSDDGGDILTGPGDQTLTDPMLGPLQNNGGSTLTHALLPGSPAINAGDPSFTPPPFFDQRGPAFARVVNGRVDIGSFEVQGLSTLLLLRQPYRTRQYLHLPRLLQQRHHRQRLRHQQHSSHLQLLRHPLRHQHRVSTPRASPTPRPRLAPRPRPTPPR